MIKSKKPNCPSGYILRDAYKTKSGNLCIVTEYSEGGDLE